MVTPLRTATVEKMVSGIIWVPETFALKLEAENEALRQEIERSKGWMSVIEMFRDLGCSCAAERGTCRSCAARNIITALANEAKKHARELMVSESDDGITVKSAEINVS